MKRITITFCAAAILFACNDEKTGTNETKVAAATTETSNTAMPDSATMMKMWQDYMTPGKEHQMMASWSGTWDCETTMWMSPDAPPQKSTGVSETKMIFNGLYQQTSFKGSVNNMPFEGLATMAYDNAKKRFISSWIDNMGSGMMVTEGIWDEATKSITSKGKMLDPTTGKDTEIKEVFRIVNDDQQIMEMYCMTPDGKEYKSMEIKYTRRK